MDVGQPWTPSPAGTEHAAEDAPEAAERSAGTRICRPRSLEKETIFPSTPSRAEMMAGREPGASGKWEGVRLALGRHRRRKWGPLGREQWEVNDFLGNTGSRMCCFNSQS